MKSIRTALIVRLSSTLVAALLLVAIGLYLFLRSRFVGQFDATLMERAHLMSTLIEWEHGMVEMEVDPDAAAARNHEWFEVWQSGRVVARTESLGQRHLPQTGEFFDAVVDGKPSRGVTLAVKPRAYPGNTSQTSPQVVLVLARDRASLEADLRACSLALLAMSLVLALALPAITFRVVPAGLKPLGAFAAAVATIDAQTLDRRVTTKTIADELQPIAARLDELLERLAASFARERRFSADVAHELRTPIAELRALSEVALAGADHGGAQAPALRDAREVALQMERVVESLLALARAEAGTLVTQTVNVGETVERVWAPLQTSAQAKHLTAKLPASDQTYLVRADGTTLDTVVSNLLGNAVAYAPVGSEITIALQVMQNAIELHVENIDNTLSDADLRHVFEPFWRKDAARSDGAHSGLGLALAHASARAMGGTLAAIRLAPRRLRFILRLSV